MNSVPGAWLDQDGYHIHCEIHGVTRASLVQVHPARVVRCEEVIGAESYAEPMRCTEQAALSLEPRDADASAPSGFGFTDD